MKISVSCLLLAACLFFSTAPAQINPGCLLAAYNFNQQNVNDNIGSCNGTAVGATLVTDRFGNANSAWFLHGHPQSYLNLGTYALLKPTVGTISMWFKQDTGVFTGSGFNYNPLLHTKCQQGNNCYEAYAIYYDLSNNNLFGFTTQLFCTQPIVYTAPITAHVWHQVVYTYDNSEIKIYYDGIIQDSAVKNFQTTFLASDSIMVGTSANTQNNRQFKGAVDDIRFYGCVLTSHEVAGLFNEIPTGRNEIHGSENVKFLFNSLNNQMDLSFPAGEVYEVEVVDLLGKKLMQQHCVNGYAGFDLSPLPEGLVIFRLTDSKGQSTVRKHIINNLHQ
jgi:hypothetical protein